MWNAHEGGAGLMQLSMERNLDLGDDVMGACFTADSKYVAAAMLDASIRVLFFDTFKPFLTLYGHKLPVLAVSASSDGALHPLHPVAPLHPVTAAMMMGAKMVVVVLVLDVTMVTLVTSRDHPLRRRAPRLGRC